MDPKPLNPYLTLASCYAFLNDKEEAQEMANKILEISLGFSMAYYSGALPYKNQSELERPMKTLRKAGLPQ